MNTHNPRGVTSTLPTSWREGLGYLIEGELIEEWSDGRNDGSDGSEWDSVGSIPGVCPLRWAHEQKFLLHIIEIERETRAESKARTRIEIENRTVVKTGPKVKCRIGNIIKYIEIQERKQNRSEEQY
ncbi:hypothetical protein EVAR_59423_1 [Eumeta japonica]|uniref:Uncharacterized protein n=1 Tax=Eumeta variegata TaxID=151549 RepID=A0A4C1YY55_EUMVA|nr:hypothetical protein EVAR_59423_1 [Eumeta japonica]